MGSYTVSRLLQLIPTLMALVVIVFFSVRLLPGDAASTLSGEHRNVEAVERIRSSLGLDDPVPVQFKNYISGLFTGDLGESAIYGTSVWEEVASRYPRTFVLAAISFFIALSVGSVAGILAALRPRTIVDYSSMTLSMAGAALPVFWLGLLLVSFFAVSLQWLPAGGAKSYKSFILPALTLGLPGAGLVARMTRAALLEVMQSDYVTTARAKGRSERAILIKHALPNALLPIVTTLGLLAGSLLGGSVVVETIFAWPGIGRLLIDAVHSRDYPMIQGTLLFYGVTFVLLNVVVDLLYGVLDPRIDYVKR